MPIIFLSIQATGHVIPLIGWGSEAEGGVYLLDKLNGLNDELGFGEFTAQKKPTIDLLCIDKCRTAAILLVCRSVLPTR